MRVCVCTHVRESKRGVGTRWGRKEKREEERGGEGSEAEARDYMQA